MLVLLVVFGCKSVIRGYHACMHSYKYVWVSVVGEELLCWRELTIDIQLSMNLPIGKIMVIKDSTLVGVPKKISSIYLLFLEASVAPLQEVDSIPVS